MDFLASQNIEQLRKSVIDLAATSLANSAVLIEKGICTEAEWEATKVRVMAIMDQTMATKRDEKIAAIAAMDPVRKMFYEVTGVDLSEVEK